MPESIGSFDCLFEFEYEHVPLALYRCRDTGLRVALARVQSPVVHGYFAVSTEANDDYGCPHTLEHLVFLGSERYPFKGVLDVLANRCFAQGTNAWTDTDHTCYTVDTAGSEGFLQILPVYLDHVLFPTLTDSGFVTEVHHVNGEGANAGVVYCEMQARENEAADMCDRALKLAAYPGPCSYKSETGGRLKELRELTNATVREYHGAYYRPDNLCVIVTGLVDIQDLCRACESTVASIKQSDRIKNLPPLVRPFSSEVRWADAPSLTRIEFPAEDEKTGAMVEFAWQGPCWDDLESQVALGIFSDYLTKDATSPLRLALVETVPPLCGKVGFSMLEQTVCFCNLWLKSVDAEQLAGRNVDAEVSAVLAAAAADGGGGIDLEKMRGFLGQRRRRHLSQVEGDPHELYSGELIGAFIYAPDFAPKPSPDAVPGAALRARLDKPATLDALLAWPAERWAALCARWLIGPESSPRITVVGVPSKACGERIQKEDADRIAAQKKTMGEAGCKAAGDALEFAEDANEVDTPDEVAQRFRLPDVSGIKLIDVSTVTCHGGAGGAVEVVRGAEAAKVQSILEVSKAVSGHLPSPFFQFDHISGAQFATCSLMLPTSGLSPRQLSLLPLWCDVAFELPLAAGVGEALTYDAVVKALTDSTVASGLSLGVGGSRFLAGSAPDMLYCYVKVERERYAEAPKWIARILADAIFDVERLRVAAKRILNDVPNVKRKGRSLMAVAQHALNYRDDLGTAAFSVFRVERVLTELLASEASLAAAAAELEEVRAALLGAPACSFVRVAGDVCSVGDDVYAPWRIAPFLGGTATASPRPALAREHFAAEPLRPSAGSAGGVLLSSSAEESNYWLVQSDSLSDSRSPELAPLLVGIEYVTGLEGPFWRKIRGKGLAYGYDITQTLETGTIKFGLFKATDPLAAFEQAREILTRLCADAAAPEGDAQEAEDEDEDEEGDQAGLDFTKLEAAQSGILFELIDKGDTVPSAMSQSFGQWQKRLAPDHAQWLLSEVQSVTAEAVRAALQKYVLPLFDGSRGRAVSLVCPQQKKDELLSGLRQMSPPFSVEHFEVDDFVRALGADTGFADIRARSLQAME